MIQNTANFATDNTICKYKDNLRTKHGLLDKFQWQVLREAWVETESA